VLAVYLEARRQLLGDRFAAFWRRQEQTGTWRRLEQAVDGHLTRAREARRTAKAAERARAQAEAAARAAQQAEAQAEQARPDGERAPGEAGGLPLEEADRPLRPDGPASPAPADPGAVREAGGDVA